MSLLQYNVLHISASYIPAYIYGGPTMSVSQLAQNLAKYGNCNVSVYTTTANGKTELDITPNSVHHINGVQVTYFKRITKDHSHFSPALYIALWKNIHTFDYIHLHAWWHLVSVVSALICVLKGKKFILSPRGTLSTYSFNNRTSFLKKIFHQCIGEPLLCRANFLLTSKNEETEIKLLLNKSVKTYVLPNFVKIANQDIHLQIPDFGTFNLLFLSRVEEKKGIEFLFNALENLTISYQLTIAGTGDITYIEKLKKIAKILNIQQNLNWIGQVNNDEKFEILNKHHLLILPSYNENFANVIIESLSVGTAVLITPNVGLADFVEKNNLGWICPQNQNAIKNKIEFIYTQTEKLKIIKSIAPKIIYAAFDIENLTKQYLNFYKSTSKNKIN